MYSEPLGVFAGKFAAAPAEAGVVSLDGGKRAVLDMTSEKAERYTSSLISRGKSRNPFIRGWLAAIIVLRNQMMRVLPMSIPSSRAETVCVRSNGFEC